MIFRIEPMGKPRMTRKDVWAKRKCVLKYFAFKDELKAQARDADFKLGDTLNLTFVLTMPKSWSKKKRGLELGHPHQQKPDIDNMLKAFMDSLLDDDSGVWKVNAIKIWGEEGLIICI